MVAIGGKADLRARSLARFMSTRPSHFELTYGVLFICVKTSSTREAAMVDKTRHVDLLNIYKGPELFQPYETADGWLVVLPGEEDGRRKKYGKTVVAVTSVVISLKSQRHLLKCLSELEESDRRIRELKWRRQLGLAKGASERP